MTPWWRGRPTMDGKTDRGASSPAKPAFTMPDPLSHTMALTSPSSASGFAGGRVRRGILNQSVPDTFGGRADDDAPTPTRVALPRCNSTAARLRTQSPPPAEQPTCGHGAQALVTEVNKEGVLCCSGYLIWHLRGF